jgi:flagellar biosynthesis protein FlhF
MDVRTFEAFSMKEAVKAVKKTLGPDAVILSTKEKVMPNGKQPVFEVTAAAAQHSSKAGALSFRGNDTSFTEQSPDIDDGTTTLNARLSVLCENIPHRQQITSLEVGMSELKSILIEALRVKDGSNLHGLPPHIVPIERQLRSMGIEDACLAELMRHLQNTPIFEAGQTGESIEGYFRDHAIRWLMKRIKIAPRWNLIPGSLSIQAFAGPTGTGKSTLVAKLAAYYFRKEKCRVKVISVDQNRLAASEQMRVFCKIIGIPFASAFNAEDLTAALESSRDVDVVLIDTPGLSPKDRDGIESLKSLRSKSGPIDFHLTLSTTEKESQMDHSIRAFSPLGIQSLVFTKLDETWSYGEIFNLSRRWGLALSFFGIGRSMPEDLERATRERVVERLFGIK